VDRLLDADLDALLQRFQRSLGSPGASASAAEARAAADALRAGIGQAVTEAVHRERGEFLARVNHEVRTPLNGILGFVDLARREPLPAQVSEHLQLAHQSGAQLSALLDDLLALQRLDAGEAPVLAGAVDPRALARDLDAAWRDRAARKGLSFGTSVAADVPGSVVVDGASLRQLLEHLTSNAVKFTDRGGVMVSIRALERDGLAATLRVDVTDTGPGFTPEELPRLLLPFEQGHRFNTRAHGGAGLGLPLASRLATRLGGSLVVDSAPGEGSEFIVTVPVSVAAEAPPEPAAPAAAARGASLRVLLVEDNTVNQVLGVALLQREGHRVRVASNGREAVDAVRDEAIDLVLMDLQMPEMDGYEAAVRIRSLDAARGRRTPIVALTAHGDAHERRRCLALGMDDFIGKPLDWPALRRTLARRQERGAAGAPSEPRPPAPDGTLDVASLRARVAGRRDVLQRLVEAFREQHPSQRSALRSAAGRGNEAELRAVAHKMIGTLSCFSATAAVALARDVERRAIAGDLVGIQTHLDALDRAVEAIEPELTRLARDGFGEETAS
jgi:signal transduction histidine kinase/DNA-binding response OmpR family regulator